MTACEWSLAYGNLKILLSSPARKLAGINVKAIPEHRSGPASAEKRDKNSVDHRQPG